MTAKGKKITYLVMITAAVAIVIAYLIWRKKKAAAAAAPTAGQTQTGIKGSPIMGVPTEATQLPSLAFPINPGAKGAQVLYVQGFLNMYKQAGLTLDGKYGPNTAKAWTAATGKDQICQGCYDMTVGIYQAYITQYLRQEGKLPLIKG